MIALRCAGDYDYDESEDLPLGCQYSDESSFKSSGALYLPSASGTGRAPSLAPSPSTAARKHAVVVGSAANGSEAVLRILCKPMPAKTAPLQQGTATQQSNTGGGSAAPKLDGSIIFLICFGGVVFVGLVLCCIAGCLSKATRRLADRGGVALGVLGAMLEAASTGAGGMEGTGAMEGTVVGVAAVAMAAAVVMAVAAAVAVTDVTDLTNGGAQKPSWRRRSPPAMS